MCGVVYYSELFPNHIRSKGVALAIATLALTDLVYLQATSTAFANIGWKFFLVFIIISGLGAIYLWIFLVETKGLPLEEMAAIFGDDEDVAVFISDVNFDQETHEVVFEDHHHQQQHIGQSEQKEISQGSSEKGTAIEHENVTEKPA